MAIDRDPTLDEQSGVVEIKAGDSDNRLDVDAKGRVTANDPPNPASFVTGQQAVTTAGTPVQMLAQAIAPGCHVLIKAKKANTGAITVGNSSANALNTGTVCFRLAANESLLLEISDLSLIWIDSTVSLEGVEYITEA